MPITKPQMHSLDEMVNKFHERLAELASDHDEMQEHLKSLKKVEMEKRKEIASIIETIKGYDLDISWIQTKGNKHKIKVDSEEYGYKNFEVELKTIVSIDKEEIVENWQDYSQVERDAIEEKISYSMTKTNYKKLLELSEQDEDETYLILDALEEKPAAPSIKYS